MGARAAMRLWPVLVVLAGALPGVAPAQVATSAVPVYHGVLTIRPAASGTIDRKNNGTALVKVPRWPFKPTENSNGIFPDQEPIVVAIGNGADDQFGLDAGMLRPSRSGKVFLYRATRPFLGRMIRLFRLQRTTDGYLVRFTISGVDLSTLTRKDPFCTALAVIVGDDDGFAKVSFSSPSFDARGFRVTQGFCDVPWTWLGR